MVLMQLTQKQEWLIDRYLRAVGEAVDNADAQVAAVDHVRRQIHQALRRHSSGRLRDEDLVALFQELGSPASQAALYRQRYRIYSERGGLSLSATDRVWLGVCGGIAARLSFPSRYVRYAALALGVTGPLALILYLSLYIWLYVDSEDPAVPRIDIKRLAPGVALMAAAVVAMDAGMLGMRVLLVKLVALVTSRALPALGAWGWLEGRRGTLLFWALLVILPLSILGRLPLAESWDATLWRLAKVALALYGAVLCLGLASHLVGLLLHVSESVGL